jgi:6-pyruvoyltetrahydropterin/6-carboxytetrahydropterin synthase
MFKSTKQYGHDIGLSCCFRQHRAESHCALLHGYAIAVKLTFRANELDHRNWVQDFGGLKEVKSYLQRTFDHKLLVASDDPDLDTISGLQGLGIAEVIVVENVGCEAFAKMIFDAVKYHILRLDQDRRVVLESVEVKEHGANSAIYSEIW